MMIPIAFPEPAFNVREENGKAMIWDMVRKKFVMLTPEEWVRQNFIHYLVKVKHCPPGLLSVEKELRLGTMRKRYDLLVYKNDTPWMMVECKEQATKINASVLDQILRYNMSLPVQYLVLTNGAETYCIERDGKSGRLLQAIPDYQDIA